MFLFRFYILIRFWSQPAPHILRDCWRLLLIFVSACTAFCAFVEDGCLFVGTVVWISCNLVRTVIRSCWEIVQYILPISSMDHDFTTFQHCWFAELDHHCWSSFYIDEYVELNYWRWSIEIVYLYFLNLGYCLRGGNLFGEDVNYRFRFLVVYDGTWWLRWSLVFLLELRSSDGTFYFYQVLFSFDSMAWLCYRWRIRYRWSCWIWFEWIFLKVLNFWLKLDLSMEVGSLVGYYFIFRLLLSTRAAEFFLIGVDGYEESGGPLWHKTGFLVVLILVIFFGGGVLCHRRSFII